MRVVLGWHVLLVAGFALWVFLLPAQHSGGGCDGIGWGCTPNPRDGALLVGTFLGLPILCGLVIVSALLTVALAALLRPGWLAGTAGTFITWFVALVAASPLLGW